jgi:uncharacterized repeat protein (TIGR03803 family)
MRGLSSCREKASDGNFYGTTGAGGLSNVGTIFRLTPKGTVARLYTFTGGLDGRYPSALIQATDGNLYGTSFGGGASGEGTIFRMTLAGVFATMYAFSERPDGAEPDGPLGCALASLAAHSISAVTHSVTPARPRRLAAI